jgi:predicted ABC-type ATPase
MRIKTIQLSWFRGAADPVSLEPDCKSMVVYGENGSGKSSFVDAVEYILNNGRITHLAHEYSGKHQEKAVHNTHKPQGQTTELRIRFKDGSELKTEIAQNGISTSSGAEAIAMNTWNYRRTVLRQDEVATFVHDTKGDKYSALLPLLGLDQMTFAAENLKQLVKSIEQHSTIKETKAILKVVETKRKATFDTASDGQILKKIEELHTQYCPDKAKTTDALSRCKELEVAIECQSAQFSSYYARYLVLQGISKLELKDHVKAVRSANSKLAGTVESLIVEKLEVLQSTGAFVNKLKEEKEVKCPACGRSIPVDALQTHVMAERERLQEIIGIYDTRKAAIATLCDTVKSLKSFISRSEVKSWRDELAKGPLANNFAYLDAINVESLRASCDEENLVMLEGMLLPLIDAAALASKNAPPEVQKLSADKQTVDVGKTIIEAMEQATYVVRVEALTSFINSLEQSLREKIRIHTETVIKEISVDIQRMWGILHPGNAIEEVRLYLPPDADKAIDIAIKFHGVEQPSPRLTLSEGYRNSLGLSIFLSMAKRESDKDRPLFLDDVIVSLDRNHRGMIVDLLEKEFAERQVIILTHDREWYTELRQQLDGKNWIFKTLLPYETPNIGIRWSHKTTTFDDARAHLKERPDSAGNDARKIMDVELALIAERLQINVPYLRAEKNDQRMAHDFLERLVGNGKKCFQKKVEDDYEDTVGESKIVGPAPHRTPELVRGSPTEKRKPPQQVGDSPTGASSPTVSYEIYSEAIEAFDQADRLIVSWANRASHTFDLVQPEATKLIDTCEKALEFFKCSSCGKSVWLADAKGSEWVQCQCGEIRWRYGKG